MFVYQLQQRVRIAVGILCSSWHMGHPPKAMKYITCGVIPFRPWHAFCGPLVRLATTAASLSPSFISLYISIASSPHLFYQIATVPVFWFRSILPSPFITPISSLCNCLHPSPSLPPAWSSSVTGVPGSAAAHCGAMIQKPHINTGISPRDYLSVACLPGRVLPCNLYCAVNRVGLGERGFVRV